MSDRHQLLSAPVPWREQACVEIVAKFIQMYRDNMNVDLMEALKDTDYIGTLTRIEEKIAVGRPPKAHGSILEKLEVFHKVLVFYLWMGFRNPVSYNCHDEVSDLKARVEKALDWTLQGVSKLDPAERLTTQWEDIKVEKDLGRQHIAYKSKLTLKSRRAAVV
jgi:ATP-dependent RNA helicase SUPV3L1/SUV3